MSPSRSPRLPRALRLNLPALVATLVFSVVMPLLIHGMSLFVGTFLPLVVVATTPFLLR